MLAQEAAKLGLPTTDDRGHVTVLMTSYLGKQGILTRGAGGWRRLEQLGIDLQFSVKKKYPRTRAITHE